MAPGKLGSAFGVPCAPATLGGAGEVARSATLDGAAARGAAALVFCLPFGTLPTSAAPTVASGGTSSSMGLAGECGAFAALGATSGRGQNIRQPGTFVVTYDA